MNLNSPLWNHWRGPEGHQQTLGVALKGVRVGELVFSVPPRGAEIEIETKGGHKNGNERENEKAKSGAARGYNKNKNRNKNKIIKGPKWGQKAGRAASWHSREHKCTSEQSEKSEHSVY